LGRITEAPKTKRVAYDWLLNKNGFVEYLSGDDITVYFTVNNERSSIKPTIYLIDGFGLVWLVTNPRVITNFNPGSNFSQDLIDELNHRTV